jgi:hypothetical protein
MNSNRKRLRPDHSITPNKPVTKRHVADKSPHLPTPNVTCTPHTIIKSKRLRPKPKAIEKPLNVSMSTLPINLERFQKENIPPPPKSAPASPFLSVAKFKPSYMTPFSNSKLKPPKTFLKEKPIQFFHRNFHVTDFDLKEQEPTSSTNEFESELVRDRLNYRLFRTPPKDPSA